jgi:hypothetical protein
MKFGDWFGALSSRPLRGLRFTSTLKTGLRYALQGYASEFSEEIYA